MAAKKRETIQLGDTEFEISTLPMSEMWEVLDLYQAFWDAKGNLFDKPTRDTALQILSRALRKDPSEVLAMPMDLKDLQTALLAIGRVCGLEMAPTSTPAGEARATEQVNPPEPSAASIQPSQLN